MAGWRKLYVIRDEKRKPEPTSRRPRPPRAPKVRRRGIRYAWALIWVVIAFGGGLYLGLREDYAAEELDPELAEAVFGGEAPIQEFKLASASPRPKKEVPVTQTHIFADWHTITEPYFEKRRKQRSISLEEVQYVIKYGHIDSFWPDNEHDYKPQPKFNLRAITPENRDILVSFTVPLDKKKSIILVNTIDKDN